MINSYVSEQLVRELEEMFHRTKLPSLEEIKQGITIQELSYWSGVKHVIDVLRYTSEHGGNEPNII